MRETRQQYAPSNSKRGKRHLRGAAIEVPERVLTEVSDVYPAAVILDPGAKMSKQLPKLLNQLLLSLVVVDPTVMAREALAGEKLQAFESSFPAATTMTIPEFMAELTALSRVLEGPPPRLKLATDLLLELCRPSIQSIPATTPETVPDPVLLRTLTGMILAFLATPYDLPAAIPVHSMMGRATAHKNEIICNVRDASQARAVGFKSTLTIHNTHLQHGFRDRCHQLLHSVR